MDCLRISIAAAMLAWVSAASASDAQELCEAPSESCSRLMQVECLGGMGAGVLRVDNAGEAASGGCDAQLDAYRQCLSTVASECQPGAAALDLTRLPSFQPFQAMSCSSELSRQMMCQGADHLLSAMVTSGDETDREVFATMGGGIYIFDGGARRVAAFSDRINAFAQFMQNIAIPLPQAPSTLGFCLTFRPQGGEREWALAQALRFTSQTPAAVAQTTGQQLFMAAPASPQVVFRTSEASCEEKLAALAAEFGL